MMPGQTRYLQRSRMYSSKRGKRLWTQDSAKSPHRYLIAIQLLSSYSKKDRQSQPLEAPVIIASFPSSGLGAVPAAKFVDKVLW